MWALLLFALLLLRLTPARALLLFETQQQLKQKLLAAVGALTEPLGQQPQPQQQQPALQSLQQQVLLLQRDEPVSEQLLLLEEEANDGKSRKASLGSYTVQQLNN